MEKQNTSEDKGILRMSADLAQLALEQLRIVCSLELLNLAELPRTLAFQLCFLTLGRKC